MRTAIVFRVTRITLPKYCHLIGLIHVEQVGHVTHESEHAPIKNQPKKNSDIQNFLAGVSYIL